MRNKGIIEDDYKALDLNNWEDGNAETELGRNQ